MGAGRTPSCTPQHLRSPQVGLSVGAVDAYVDRWIVGIKDISTCVLGLRPWCAATRQSTSRTGSWSAYPLPDNVVRVSDATFGTDVGS